MLSPEMIQRPGTCGLSVGRGVLAAIVSLKVTLIGAAPLAAGVPLPGVTDSICSGATSLAGAAGLEFACAPVPALPAWPRPDWLFAALASASRPLPWETAANVLAAIRTATAELAIPMI